MASVRLEESAFSDLRFDRLASELGLADADHARGKMLRLWRQCTDEQTHTLDTRDVSAVLGARGVDALVASRLAELCAGGVRIRGTRGRIEWLGTIRGNGKHGKLGGRPRKKQSAQDNPQGLSQPNPQGFGHETPLAVALAVAVAPAVALSPDQTSKSTSTDLSDPLREPDIVDSPKNQAPAARDAHRDPGSAGAAITADIEAVFAAYRRHHPRAHPKPKSTSREVKLLKARLSEGHSVEDLVSAVDGCHASAWHMGDNDRGRPYNSLELILRDASKVQFFSELARAGPAPPTLAQLPRADRERAAVMRASEMTGGWMYEHMLTDRQREIIAKRDQEKIANG